MTLLLITLPDDAPGTTPARLLLEAWPRLDGRPAKQFYDLTDDTVNAINAVAPDPDWFYFATIYRAERVVAVRAITFSGEQCHWADATDVDPGTFEPADPADTVGSQLAEIRADLELRPIVVKITDAAYDALTPAEQNDPGKLFVTPIEPIETP